MKFLVTGSAGFIGSHLCEALVKEGHTTVGIDNFDSFYAPVIKRSNLVNLLGNPLFRFYECDITDRKSLEQLKDNYDVVIHLAAKAGVRPSIEDPSGYIQTNIQGTQHILDLALECKVSKIVFASSSSVYGNNIKIPFSEKDDVGNPISPYAFTKRAGELMLYNYYHLYAINSISLRFFTVFGPRQRPDLAIHKFFKSIYNQTPISVFGDGSTYRDYTFVDDIVKGILEAVGLIIKQPNIYEIINIGNNNPVSLKELIQLIEKVTNKKANLQYKEMQPGDVTGTFADISKAAAMLSYHPATSMEEGLIKFNEWYKGHSSV